MNKSSVIVNEEAIDRVFEKVKKILLKKNHDYGDAWQRHGAVGVMVRLSDKSLRLESLSSKEALVLDENISDTLFDIIGYSVLGLLWYGESVGDRNITSDS